jgi:hypothetical protein
MFQQLKKVLRQEKTEETAETDEKRVAWVNTHPESDLSSSEGLGAIRAGATNTHILGGAGTGIGTSIEGVVQGKPWKLERSAASRNYISGEEIRGRADIGIDPQISVIIMNRPLKELLEKRAYALYTDSIETEASPTLMEEMRWLALYPQVGWERVADSFWHRYAVMTSQRSHAMGWLTPKLADLLMAWPEPSPSAENPFILMVMRGRMHLRMQLTPSDASTLKHITRIFTAAAESAIDVFSAQPEKAPKLSRK